MSIRMSEFELSGEFRTKRQRIGIDLARVEAVPTGDDLGLTDHL